MKREVYNSSTLGPIPLSFTGRRLLQNLREEIEEFVEERLTVGKGTSWEGISRARGKLAQYMSKLEDRQVYPSMNWRDPAPLDTLHSESVEGKVAQTHTAPFIINLPPIPEGYMLNMVGSVMTIEPIQMDMTGDPTPHHPNGF